MEENKIDDLNQLIEDIKFIKTSIKKNNIRLREMIYTLSIQITSLFTGIMTVVFSFLYYYSITKYSGYANIPSVYRTLLIIGVIISTIIASLIKTTVYIFLKQKYPYENYIGMTLKLFAREVLFVYFVLLGVIFYLSIYFGIIEKPQFIVPVACTDMGICFYLMTGFINLFEILSLGMWLILTGLISVPFISANPLNSFIWLAVSAGAGYILFPVITQITRLIDMKNK